MKVSTYSLLTAALALGVFSANANTLYDFTGGTAFDDAGVGTGWTLEGLTLETVDIIGTDGTSAVLDSKNHRTKVHPAVSLGIVTQGGSDTTGNFEMNEAWVIQFDKEVDIVSIDFASIGNASNSKATVQVGSSAPITVDWAAVGMDSANIYNFAPNTKLAAGQTISISNPDTDLWRIDSITFAQDGILTNGGFEVLTGGTPEGWFQRSSGGSVSPASSGDANASGDALGAFAGDYRSFDSVDTIFQLTDVAPEVGDSLDLDFWGNAAGVNQRSWSGKVVLDGGDGTRVVLGEILLAMDQNTGTWEQANDAGITFTVDASQIATAGSGATYGVEFDSVTGDFIGIDQVSLYVAAIPEPSSLALLGLGGLMIARRRRG